MEELFLQEYQPLVFAQLKKSIKHGRIAHAYLFEGDKGTGKHELSLWLAKRLFVPMCKKKPRAALAAIVCGSPKESILTSSKSSRMGR